MESFQIEGQITVRLVDTGTDAVDTGARTDRLGTGQQAAEMSAKTLYHALMDWYMEQGQATPKPPRLDATEALIKVAALSHDLSWDDADAFVGEDLQERLADRS